MSVDIITLHARLLNEGLPIEGVSWSARDELAGTKRVDFLPGATAEERSRAHQIADGFASLAVSVDKSEIAADGVEAATIICDDAAVGGEVDVDFEVTLDGVVYASGTALVEGGAATLTLATVYPGVYVVEIRRPGSWQNGFVKVRAT